MVFTGLGLVVLAVAFAALTHRALTLAKELERMKAGEHRTLRPAMGWKGIIVSLVAGILLGVYSPLVSAAKRGELGIGPYSLAVMFTLGILFSSVIYNLYLTNLPLQGRPVEIPEYFRGRVRTHILGLLGGIMWAAGMLGCWVVAGAPEEAQLSPGTTFALLQSAPLVTALWGVLVWKEFKQGDARSVAYLIMTLFLLLAGLVTLALAPFSAMP
jgi:glucose uptake protein